MTPMAATRRTERPTTAPRPRIGLPPRHGATGRSRTDDLRFTKTLPAARTCLPHLELQERARETVPRLVPRPVSGVGEMNPR